MRLRPELVLLQKTMMVAEGVARRLWPEHDIWAAADPVVRRYIIRELAPPARLRRLAEHGLKAAEALVRRVESPAGSTPVVITAPVTVQAERASVPLLWFAAGAAAAGLAFAVAALLR